MVVGIELRSFIQLSPLGGKCLCPLNHLADWWPRIRQEERAHTVGVLALSALRLFSSVGKTTANHVESQARHDGSDLLLAIGMMKTFGPKLAGSQEQA